MNIKRSYSYVLINLITGMLCTSLDTIDNVDSKYDGNFRTSADHASDVSLEIPKSRRSIAFADVAVYVENTDPHQLKDTVLTYLRKKIDEDELTLEDTDGEESNRRVLSEEEEDLNVSGKKKIVAEKKTEIYAKQDKGINEKIPVRNKSEEPEEEQPSRRMIGGSDASIGQFGFMVSIHRRNKFWCAGVLVRNDFVLTTASCLQYEYNNRFYKERPKIITVRAGCNFTDPQDTHVKYRRSEGSSSKYDKNVRKTNSNVTVVRDNTKFVGNKNKSDAVRERLIRTKEPKGKQKEKTPGNPVGNKNKPSIDKVAKSLRSSSVVNENDKGRKHETRNDNMGNNSSSDANSLPVAKYKRDDVREDNDEGMEEKVTTGNVLLSEAKYRGRGRKKKPSTNAPPCVQFQALEFFFHPNYDPIVLSFNFALIRLEYKYPYDKNHTMIVAIQDDNPVPITATVLILGWGAVTEDGSMRKRKKRLQQAVLPIYPNVDCAQRYGKQFIHEDVFCTGPIAIPTGGCNHDMGGAAVSKQKLIGLFSSGPVVCGDMNSPNIFARVGAAKSWINKTIEAVPRNAIVKQKEN